MLVEGQSSLCWVVETVRVLEYAVVSLAAAATSQVQTSTADVTRVVVVYEGVVRFEGRAQLVVVYDEVVVRFHLLAMTLRVVVAVVVAVVLTLVAMATYLLVVFEVVVRFHLLIDHVVVVMVLIFVALVTAVVVRLSLNQVVDVCGEVVVLFHMPIEVVELPLLHLVVVVVVVMVVAFMLVAFILVALAAAVVVRLSFLNQVVGVCDVVVVLFHLPFEVVPLPILTIHLVVVVVVFILVALVTDANRR